MTRMWIGFVLAGFFNGYLWAQENRTNYQPVDNGYRITNSQVFFNRGLYGDHTNDDNSERYFTLAGDQPLIMGAVTDWRARADCLHAKSGTFMLGVAMTPGVYLPFRTDGDGIDRYSQWFHKSVGTVATYRNGWMEYEIEPLFYCFPHVKAKVEVYPLMPEDGFLVRLKVTTDQRVILCMGFGGITGYIGSFDSSGAPNKYFRAEDCKDNIVSCKVNKAEIRDGSGKLPTKSLWVGSSFPAGFSVGDAKKALLYPSKFLEKDGNPSDTPMVRMSCIVEQGQTLDGFIVVVRNQKEDVIDKWLAKDLPEIDIKQKIRQVQSGMEIKTPDEMLNLTVPPTVLGMDSCWHKNVFHHGAYVWATPYLGFRNWYGPTVMGWQDRVETCFKTHATGLVVEEKFGDAFLPSMLGGKNNGYNMQEVAIDMFLHSLEWSGNLDFAKKEFDVVDRCLAWEKRKLDVDGDCLYANRLNHWASDSQWHRPDSGCAVATAFNYSANKRMANVAAKIGRDPSAFHARAEKIKESFDKNLWLSEKGVVAEYVETTGNKLTHPSPQLPAIYHTIESGLLNDFQAYQLLRFTETDLRNEYSLVRKGRMVWLSNWYPQIWTSCGLYPAENIHLALAYFRNGQTEKAMEIFKGLVEMYFMGINPGVIGYMQNSNGHSDGFGDFTDLNSMYLRCIAEGLFGIRSNLLDNYIEVAPNFPKEWDHANLRLRDVSVNFYRNGREDNLTINRSKNAPLILKMPMRATHIEAVLLNGVPVEHHIEARINRSDVVITTAQTGDLNFTIVHGGDDLPTIKNADKVQPGENILFEIAGGSISEYSDPSHALADVKVTAKYLNGKAVGGVGSHTVFIRVKQGHYDCWRAGDFSIFQLPQAKPKVKSQGQFESLDISTSFNHELKEVKHEFWTWTQAGPTVIIDDSALRQSGGKFRTPSGLQFATPSSGKNVACAALSYGEKYPHELSISLSGKAAELEILFIGVTNQMQSRVENARFVVNYMDGSSETVVLRNPDNFDDWTVAAVQQENETAYFSDYNHAIVQRIAVNPEKELKNVSVQPIANEVVVGVLGINLQRNPKSGK